MKLVIFPGNRILAREPLTLEFGIAKGAKHKIGQKEYLAEIEKVVKKL